MKFIQRRWWDWNQISCVHGLVNLIFRMQSGYISYYIFGRWCGILECCVWNKQLQVWELFLHYTLLTVKIMLSSYRHWYYSADFPDGSVIQIYLLTFLIFAHFLQRKVMLQIKPFIKKKPTSNSKLMAYL